MLYTIALARAPRGVLANSQALRLCAIEHKRNYALQRVMCCQVRILRSRTPFLLSDFTYSRPRSGR